MKPIARGQQNCCKNHPYENNIKAHNAAHFNTPTRARHRFLLRGLGDFPYDSLQFDWSSNR